MAEVATDFVSEEAPEQEPSHPSVEARPTQTALSTPQPVDADHLRKELEAASRHLHPESTSEDTSFGEINISPAEKFLYMSLGYLCVAVGVVGVFIPGLPTTIFMIIALWAFTRSSARMRDWLYHHRHFGPALQNWVKHRSIPTAARQIALTSLLISALSIGYIFSSLACLAFVLFVGAPVATFLWTLPADSNH